jgi:hypothetical protein
MALEKGKVMPRAMIDRYALLQFAAAGSTLGFAPRMRAAAETASVGAGWPRRRDSAIHVAITRGYFTQAGLSVEHTSIRMAARVTNRCCPRSRFHIL